MLYQEILKLLEQMESKSLDSPEDREVVARHLSKNLLHLFDTIWERLLKASERP
jgi:hypothetical protein